MRAPGVPVGAPHAGKDVRSVLSVKYLGGWFYHVEEVHTGGKELVLTTLYKGKSNPQATTAETMPDTSETLLVEAQRRLDAVLAEFKSKIKADARVVLIETHHQGDSFVVAVHFHPTSQGTEISRIHSVYPKEAGEILSWVKNGMLTYWHNEKGQKWLSRVENELPHLQRVHSDQMQGITTNADVKREAESQGGGGSGFFLAASSREGYLESHGQELSEVSNPPTAPTGKKPGGEVSPAEGTDKAEATIHDATSAAKLIEYIGGLGSDYHASRITQRRIQEELLGLREAARAQGESGGQGILDFSLAPAACMALLVRAAGAQVTGIFTAPPDEKSILDFLKFDHPNGRHGIIRETRGLCATRRFWRVCGSGLPRNVSESLHAVRSNARPGDAAKPSGFLQGKGASESSPGNCLARVCPHHNADPALLPGGIGDSGGTSDTTPQTLSGIHRRENWCAGEDAREAGSCREDYQNDGVE